MNESIWIQKEPNCMNKDGGSYSLPTAYDRLLSTHSTSCEHKTDEDCHWQPKSCN